MGDRKTKSGQSVDAVVLDIATKGWSRQSVRDELFVQICRQTTDNPRRCVKLNCNSRMYA